MTNGSKCVRFIIQGDVWWWGRCIKEMITYPDKKLRTEETKR